MARDRRCLSCGIPLILGGTTSSTSRRVLCWACEENLDRINRNLGAFLGEVEEEDEAEMEKLRTAIDNIMAKLTFGVDDSESTS